MKLSPPKKDIKIRQVLPNGYKTWNDDVKSSLLNPIFDYKRLSVNDKIHQLEQCLSSVSSTHIRVIESDPVLFDNIAQFNQQILGRELSKSLYWQSFLSIKTKYLFSKELRSQLLQIFNQVESKFCQRDHKAFSLGNRILMSLMRTLASWDKDVSILIVEGWPTSLGTKMRVLFLQCLNELSIRASVFITSQETVGTFRPVGINFNLIN